MLLVTNLAQMLSLVVLPFSKNAFRSFNRFCANIWWSACVVSAERLYGAHLVVTGDVIPEKENAILVANHQEMSDICVLMMFARPKGRLGDLKWFVKDVIKYVPGVGWGMLFLDCLFVKRNWDADRGKIARTFSKFFDGRIPIWLISFVEGTRITQAKRARSQEYARKRGLPVLTHLLLPRTKGFVASVQGLRGHAQAVYDITIGYPEGVPTIWQIVKGSAREFHLNVRRFSLESLPQESEALSAWLIERFIEKDRLMGRFLKTGTFQKDLNTVPYRRGASSPPPALRAP